MMGLLGCLEGVATLLEGSNRVPGNVVDLSARADGERLRPKWSLLSSRCGRGTGVRSTSHSFSGATRIRDSGFSRPGLSPLPHTRAWNNPQSVTEPRGKSWASVP